MNDMTKKELAALAFEECTSEKTTAHHGGGAGRPFWNAEAIQFMYVPAFHFQALPGVKEYRFEAKDETGALHVFTADAPTALLTPIWGEIPEGVVELKVWGRVDGEDKYLVGARTFFKLAPFSDDLPAAACGYKEAAMRAYDFAMSQSLVNHWLLGTPDPDYDHNVYPSKMISSVVNAMIDYARLVPEKSEEAMKIAVNAADYLISITPTEGPMAFLPPTYQIDFRDHPETRENLTAEERLHTVMMIYPAYVGVAYLNLEKATGDKKYLEAAEKIGDYFRAHIEPAGSWYLIRDYRTGEVLSPNLCDPLGIIVPFLSKLYERTGEESWKKLADCAIRYVEDKVMVTYEWEGQFEDSVCSANYSNLTHYGASALTRYYAAHFADDGAYMAKADDLMRFVEDQFVVWKKAAPWNKNDFDTTKFLTPAGLEQYKWYVPIDASTADIAETFLAMYKAGRGELHLAKAMALADGITRSQRENGMIPTHWLSEESLEGDNFWINCMFVSASLLSELGTFLEEKSATKTL